MASTEDDVVVRLRLKDVARFIADVKSGKLAIDDLEKKISKAGRTAAKESESSGGGFGKLGKVLGGLKWYALGAVGSLAAATGGTIAYAIKSTASLEQVQVAYTTLLHSQSAATDMITRLQKFARDTPFELAGVEESTQKLLSFGFTAKTVIPTLTAVGNAASGLNLGQGGMDEIITALGQMRMKGRVQGDELLQLAEHGVNAYGYLQRGLKLTPAQLQKAVQAGKVSAATAIPLILKGMDTQFRGLMAKESGTLGGIWSNLHDAVEQGLVRITSPYLPAMKKWLQDLVDRMPQIEAFLSRVVTDTIGGIGTTIDIGKRVFAWGKDAATQAADWVKSLIALIQTAVASGDWSPVGASLGTSLRGLLLKGVNLGDAVGGAAQGIDWFEVGKKFAGGAIGFVLGFAIALFDPGTWWPVIQKHWLAILIGVLTMLPIGKVLGVFGKVLAKLPLLGKLGEWLVGLGGGLMKAGGPVWKFIGHIASGIGNAFVKVWPELGTRLWYWGSRIGEFFSRDVPGLAAKLKAWVTNGAKGFVEWIATKFFQGIDALISGVRRVAGAVWRPLQGAFITVLSWLTDKWEAFIGVVTGAVGAVTGAINSVTGSSTPGNVGDTHSVRGGHYDPSQWPHQATGGTTIRAGASWVGERGPELLNLPRGAQVIPLPRMPEAVGRGPVHVHVMLDKREIAQAVYDDMGDRVARR